MSIKFIYALGIVVILGIISIPQQPSPTKTIKLPAIRPTPLGIWIDTIAARYAAPVEVIEGIGWKESHLGNSPLARRTNNLFGIKCGDGWRGDRAGTWRKYPTRYESVEDFAKYMHKYYSYLIGKPLGQWRINGYASKPYKF